VFKLIVRLAVVALLANACYHIGSQYLTHIKLRDAIRDAAMFKARNDTELLTRIMALAEQYEVPLEEENLSIEREDRQVKIEGWYDQPIEVLPNYQYPWHFGLSMSVLTPTSVRSLEP